MIGVERFEMAQFTGAGGTSHEPVPPDPEVLKAQQFEHWKKGAIRRSYGKFTEMVEGEPFYAYAQLADRMFTAGFEMGVRTLSQTQVTTMVEGVKEFGIVEIRTIQHGGRRPRYFLGEGPLQAVARIAQEMSEMSDFSGNRRKPLAGVYVLDAMSKGIDLIRKSIQDPEHPVIASINQENVEVMNEAIVRLKEGKHMGGPKGSRKHKYELPRGESVPKVKFPLFDEPQKAILEGIDAARVSELQRTKIRMTSFDPTIRAAVEVLLSCQEVTSGRTFEPTDPQTPYNVARLRASLKLAHDYLNHFGNSSDEAASITNLGQLVSTVKSIMEKQHPELIAKLRV